MGEKEIGLIGCGRLGLSFALLCDSNGYEVNVFELNKERAQQIKDKTLKSTEPQIEDLLKTSNLKVGDSIKEVVESTDLIFILVATPSLESGEYDHSQIESVVSELQKLDSLEGKTIIISATVMPSYCKDLQERLPLVNIIYNPEFISQGNVVNGLKEADIVLIGGENIPEKLFQLYRDIQTIEPTFKMLSLTGAELAKISINCFLTVKIAFANIIWEIAENLGEGGEKFKLLDTIGSDSRIGNKFLQPGFGYGGPCLVRDQKALGVAAKKVGLSDSFQKTIDLCNEEHFKFLKNFYLKEIENGYAAYFEYLTYKSGTDLLIESQQYKLALELLTEGHSIIVLQDMSKLDLPQEFRNYIELGKAHQLCK